VSIDFDSDIDNALVLYTEYVGISSYLGVGDNHMFLILVNSFLIC